MVVFAIVWKDIKWFLGNAPVLIFLFGIPVFLIWIMKTVIGGSVDAAAVQQASGAVELILLGGKGVSLANRFICSTFVQALFIDGIAVTSTLMNEKEQLTMMRTITTPVRRSTILLGNLAGHMTIMLVIASVVLGVTQVLIPVNWSKSVLNLTVVVIFICFAATSLGTGVSMLSKNSRIGIGVGSLLVMVMAFLSGGFSRNDSFSKIEPFTINSWALKAITGIMNGAELHEIALDLAVLGIFGVTVLAAVWFVFRREKNYE